MIKININEADVPLYEVNSMQRQVHFLNFKGLLNNISRFIEGYSEKCENIETKIRNVTKRMIEEVNIHLKSHGINIEYFAGQGVKTESKFNSGAFLKVNDPNSLGFILKVVNGRMLVKVNRFEAEENIELFVLSHEKRNSLKNHYFDDFKSFVNMKGQYPNTIGYRENELKKNLKIWDEFKPREWRNASSKVSIGKGSGIVSTALSFVSSLENYQGKDNNFEVANKKHFLIDSDVNNNLIHKEEVKSLFLIPVGTIVGTTIKHGINALGNVEEFKKKNTSIDYKEEFAFREIGDICSNVGITINRVFW